MYQGRSLLILGKIDSDLHIAPLYTRNITSLVTLGLDQIIFYIRKNLYVIWKHITLMRKLYYFHVKNILFYEVIILCLRRNHIMFYRE